MMNTTNYEIYFEGNNVPENLKTIAIAVMKRFTITGLCDGMYICNMIAQYSGIGDGCSNFTGNEVKNIPAIAEALQSVYGCNICKEDISELEDILRTGILHKEKAISGIRKYIAKCTAEKRSCDGFRVDYLDRCISKATMALTSI